MLLNVNNVSSRPSATGSKGRVAQSSTPSKPSQRRAVVMEWVAFDRTTTLGPLMDAPAATFAKASSAFSPLSQRFAGQQDAAMDQEIEHDQPRRKLARQVGYPARCWME